MASDMSMKRKLDFLDGREAATIEGDKKARGLPDAGFSREYGYYAPAPANPDKVYIKEEIFDEFGYSMQNPAEVQPLNLALTSPRPQLIDHQPTPTADRLLKSDFCDYQNLQGFELMDHRSMREGRFSCKLCNFKCAQKSGLTFHQKTHVVKHPFSCTNCDFQCFKVADLVSHQSVYMCNKRPNLIQHLNIPNF